MIGRRGHDAAIAVAMIAGAFDVALINQRLVPHVLLAPEMVAQPIAQPPALPLSSPAQRAIEPEPVPDPPARRRWSIYFDYGANTLGAGDRPVLEEIAASKTKLIISGYADRTGPRDFNFALSVRRARAVGAELERLGVPAGQLEVIGRGVLQAPDPALARRVDIETR